jgi:hypothetical protein
MAGDGRGVLENVGGAFQILWAWLTPFLRGRRVRWGATSAEWERTWPGDGLVAAPRWQCLHGITVEAPAEKVWPWVAQIGQGRGGFYSYERLENLVGCRIRNADRILPEHQDLGAIAGIRLAAKAPAMPLAVVEPGRGFVLYGAGDMGGAEKGPDGATSWGVFVEAAGPRAARVFSRQRSTWGRGWGAALMFGPWVLEPISFVMDRKMLRGIKRRAEAARFGP